MDGWVHLPRLVDKIRLHEAGQLHEDYQPNYLHKGFDLAWFEASGVAPDTLVEVVKNSITDGQVSDWVKANVNKTDADREALSTSLLSYGTEGALLERLIQRKAESGLQDRDDIQCMFQYIDADEGTAHAAYGPHERVGLSGPQADDAERIRKFGSSRAARLAVEFS